MKKLPWLILTHQLPVRPSNVRVKIWRKLQVLGSIPIKNSIYVLPNNPETREDFEWLRKEIIQMKGEASIFLSDSIHQIENREIVRAFQEARTKDYADLIRAFSKFLDYLKNVSAGGHIKPESLTRADKEWGKVKANWQRLQKIDFFHAPNRAKAASLAAIIQKLFDHVKVLSLKGVPQDLPSVDTKDLKMRIWVTRKSPHIDRLASAWLIRRYVNPRAGFKFVSEPYKSQSKNEIRFDMYDAEFTHYGDWCTFETFVHRLGLKDPILKEISEIVHDIDLKDEKFKRTEAHGLSTIIQGLCQVQKEDMARIEIGLIIFNALHASLKYENRKSTK